MDTKTTVFVSTGESIDTAQIAFIDELQWCVYGPYLRQSGLFQFAQMPQLPNGTPIVNLAGIQNKDAAKKIIHRHLSIEGIDNPGILAKLLQGLGATVGYSVGGAISK